MALWVPTVRRLSEMRFETLRADGGRVLHNNLVQGWSWSETVTTAGVESQTVLHGALETIAEVGDVGTTARISGPMVDVETGESTTGVLWEGMWETLVDERHETHLTRYYTGFDVAKLLANTTADFVSTNDTLSEVVRNVCDEYGLPVGDIPTTVTPLGQIVIRGRSAWDIILEAVQRHHDLTGDTYRVLADGTSISLRRQGADAIHWTFRVGSNVEAIRRERSVLEVVNRVWIHGRAKGDASASPVIEVVEDLESQRLYGVRQSIEYAGGETSISEAVQTARTRLNDAANPTERLTLTGLTTGGLRAGDRIRAVDEAWGFDRLYYVESVQVNVNSSEARSVLTVHSDPIDPGLVVST